MGRTQAWLLAHGDAALDHTDLIRYRAAVARRARGEPVAYILGEAGFYGRTFAVTPDVLVPRPETEGLISLVFDTFPDRARPLRAWDVGTGSGIIAITLAAEYARARFVATDVSAAALAIAARNAAAHGVAERIDFQLTNALDVGRGDACDVPAAGTFEDGAMPTAGTSTDPAFEVILANLPYVRTADLAPRPDPTSFEPLVARDGGPDGLAVYRRLLCAVAHALAPNGLLALEAGPDTANRLASLVRAAFDGRAAMRVLPDAAGLPRIVAARRSSD